MNILSRNCRGVAAAPTMRELKDICKKQQPSIIFLMETRAHRSKIERIMRSLKFHNCFVEEADGTTRGLCLIWSRKVNIQVLSHSLNLIHTFIYIPSAAQDFNCSFVYSPPTYQERRFFWDTLRSHFTSSDTP